MAHPYHHALSSVKKWGGVVEDYMPIHDWFDATKALLADFRHRALRHHAEGIFLCEAIFGKTITLSTGKVIPVRWVGEQHVKEDLGRIPTAAEWLQCIKPEAWMGRTQKIEKDLDAPLWTYASNGGKWFIYRDTSLADREYFERNGKLVRFRKKERMFKQLAKLNAPANPR